MSTTIRRIDYFHTTVRDQPGEAYKVLTQLADVGVSLLAFTAVPVGPTSTQLTLFPADSNVMISAADKCGLTLDGPHWAFLVQGDDQLGALAGIHAKLNDAGVNVYASTGVADGRGNYGYVLYVRPGEFDWAASALEV